MSRNLRAPATLFLCWLLASLLWPSLLACSGSQRIKTLRTGLVGLNAARDSFMVWDAAKQAAIVESATSPEDGQAKLKAYREARAKLAAQFEVVYRAIAAAAVANDDPSLKAAIDAAQRLLADIDKLKGGA